MRTTLNIDDEVLKAAKELAQQEGSTVGKIISRLARRGISASKTKAGKTFVTRNGVPVFLSRGDVVTLEHIRNLVLQEGI